VIGALASIGKLAWFIGHGRTDRERDEDARDFYDAHGRWPDEG
jgi:hypothetical protein